MAKSSRPRVWSYHILRIWVKPQLHAVFDVGCDMVDFDMRIEDDEVKLCVEGSADR